MKQTIQRRVSVSLTIAILLAAFLTGCNMLGSGDDFNSKDLIGKWHAVNNAQEFLVFQDDGWGKTWDESEDVFENDLQEHGNGWFTWTLEGAKLTLIHKMDNGGADVPKGYTITTLTTSSLICKDNVTGKEIRYAK